MEFMVKTKSGSIYRFREFRRSLRVLYNGTKEVEVTKLEIKENCLVIHGYDFNIYGQKSSEEYWMHSTPIVDVQFFFS